MENGIPLKIKDMEEVFKSGLMGQDMKDIGRKIKQTLGEV